MVGRVSLVNACVTGETIGITAAKLDGVDVTMPFDLISGHPPRLIPASRSTSAGTPVSRHVPYAMPLAAP